MGEAHSRGGEVAIEVRVDMKNDRERKKVETHFLGLKGFHPLSPSLPVVSTTTPLLAFVAREAVAALGGGVEWSLLWLWLRCSKGLQINASRHRLLASCHLNLGTSRTGDYTRQPALRVGV